MSQTRDAFEDVVIYQLATRHEHGLTRLDAIPNPLGLTARRLFDSLSGVRPLYPDTDELIRLCRLAPALDWRLQGVDLSHLSGRSLGDDREEETSAAYGLAIASQIGVSDVVEKFPTLVLERVSLRDLRSQSVASVTRRGALDLGVSPAGQRRRLTHRLLEVISEAVGIAAHAS